MMRSIMVSSTPMVVLSRIQETVGARFVDEAGRTAGIMPMWMAASENTAWSSNRMRLVTV